MQGGQENADWLQRLADEEPDAASLVAVDPPPEDAFIPPGAELWWAAWHALSEERWYGDYGGCGRVRWTAIDQYARRYGLTGSSFEQLCDVIQAMDAVYVAWFSERMKQRGQRESS